MATSKSKSKQTEKRLPVTLVYRTPEGTRCEINGTYPASEVKSIIAAWCKVVAACEK